MMGEYLSKECPRHVVLDRPGERADHLWLDLLPRVRRRLWPLERRAHPNCRGVIFRQWNIAFVPINPRAMVEQHRGSCINLEVEKWRRVLAVFGRCHEELAAAIAADPVVELCIMRFGVMVLDAERDRQILGVVQRAGEHLWPMYLLAFRPLRVGPCSSVEVVLEIHA